MVVYMGERRLYGLGLRSLVSGHDHTQVTLALKFDCATSGIRHLLLYLAYENK